MARRSGRSRGKSRGGYRTNMDKAKKKLAEIGSGKFFKPKAGRNQVRILPPWNDKGLFYKEAVFYYGLTRDGKQISVPCLGRDDPISQYLKELEKGGSEDRKLAKRYAPRTKFYVNVLDRKTNKIGIWGFSRKTLSILLSYMSDPDYGDITDPDEGFDVVIEREGEKLETTYQIRVKPKPSEIGEKVDWEEEMHDLDEEIDDEITEDEMEDIIEENFGKGKRRKRSRDDEDDEEEEDEDEETDQDLKKGSRVSFELEGEEYVGTIIRINEDDEEAIVKTDDGDKVTCFLDELTPEEDEEEPEEDDEEEEPSSRRRTRTKKPKGRRTVAKKKKRATKKKTTKKRGIRR